MRPTVVEAEANGPVFWKISKRIEWPIQILPFRQIFGLKHWSRFADRGCMLDRTDNGADLAKNELGRC